MTTPFKFELGVILKDIVTGFEGVAMGRTQYFTGCNHYGLSSQILSKEGKPNEWEWFDESRMQATEKTMAVSFQESSRPTSGPHPNAPEA